jgi:hypothetical protein
MAGLASRKTGRAVAAVAGLLVLGLAVRTAIAESDPVLKLYDGYWMLGGGLAAALLAAPLAWRWPRERALGLIALASLAGAWLPLVILGLRAGVPVAARLRGAIFFASADIIGLALPVGCALCWLALQEHQGAGRAS